MSILLVVLLAMHVCARDSLNIDLPIEERIYRGENAGEHEFPTQVIFFSDFTRATITNCGGTILNEWFILTAAHCVNDTRQFPWQAQVNVGSANISEGRKMFVRKFIVHEEYTGITNDIALIKLAEPLVLDGVTVKAAILPEQDEEPASTKAIVIGTGFTDAYGSSATILQKMETKLTECHRPMLYSDAKILCVIEGSQKGLCHGDSGSPLFVDGKVVGELHGLFPTFCFKRISKIAYTKVSSYRSWIDLKMKTE
ncbi:chymotrypsin-1-like [Anabrus simplex]|uniref:chymotrypsin-1-like n=1 Tax=Anabrus simplex TaxID=316456 RepID=UPI0035A3C887